MKENKLCIAYSFYSEDQEKEDVEENYIECYKYILNKSVNKAKYAIFFINPTYDYKLEKISDEVKEYFNIFKETNLKYNNLFPLNREKFRGLILSNSKDDNVIKKFCLKENGKYIDRMYIIELNNKIKEEYLSGKFKDKVEEIILLDKDNNIILKDEFISEKLTIPTNTEEIKELEKNNYYLYYETIDKEEKPEELYLVKIKLKNNIKLLKEYIVKNTTNILIKEKGNKIIESDYYDENIDINLVENIKFYNDDKYIGEYDKNKECIFIYLPKTILIHINNFEYIKNKLCVLEEVLEYGYTKKEYENIFNFILNRTEYIVLDRSREETTSESILTTVDLESDVTYSEFNKVIKAEKNTYLKYYKKYKSNYGGYIPEKQIDKMKDIKKIDSKSYNKLEIEEKFFAKSKLEPNTYIDCLYIIKNNDMLRKEILTKDFQILDKFPCNITFYGKDKVIANVMCTSGEIAIYTSTLELKNERNKLTGRIIYYD